MSTGDLYSEYADTIESVLAYVRRSNRLTADAGDEFCSWARLRLLEDDGAILRKFRGLSTFKTYLVIVIQRLFLDWRGTEWGRWRPSLEARRLGPIAIELSKLVLRDHIEYDQAVTLLVSKGIAASEKECDEVWVQLRKRAKRAFVDIDAVGDLPKDGEDPVALAEERQRAIAVRQALRAARAELPAGDQLILKLRLESGFTVARIAKLQGVDQKALYRRFEQLYRRLHQALTASGVSEDDMRTFVGQLHDDDDGEFGSIGGNSGMGPSILPNAGGVR